MYNKNDILRLIKQGEDINLSFFGKTADIESLIETIVAMANTRGGVILIGVNPDGTIYGVSSPREFYSKITLKVDELCNPVIKLDFIKIIKIENKSVLLLLIPMAPTDNYYTMSSCPFIRDGKGNVKIDHREMYILSVTREPMKFESLIDPRAKLSDIDFEMVEKYRKKSEEKYETKISVPALTILENLGFVVTDRHKMSLNNAGILLFTKSTQKFLPESYITCVDFRERGNILRRDFYGNLFNLIDNSYNYIIDRLSDSENSAPSFLLDIDDPALSHKFVFLLKELLINAVSHRDYSVYGDRIFVFIFEDRLEVVNPGNLPGFSGELSSLKKPRNFLIHNLLTDYYFDDICEFGIENIEKTCNLLSLKDYSITFNEGHFKFVLWLVRKDDDLYFLGEEEKASLVKNEISNSEVAERNMNVIEPEISKDVLSLLLSEKKEKESNNITSLQSKSKADLIEEITQPLEIIHKKNINPVRLDKKIEKLDEVEEVIVVTTKEEKDVNSEVSKKKKVNFRERAVFEYLRKNSSITRVECETLLNIEPRTANRLLKALVGRKHLTKKGSGTKFYYVLCE